MSFVLGNNVLSNVYYHKKVGVNILRYFRLLFKGILPVWVVTVGVGLLLNAVIPLGGWGGFIAKGACYVGVYILAIILFGLNHTEKQLVQKALNRVRGNRRVG